MAHVSPFEFARAVQSTCDRSDLVAAYNVQILDDTVVKVQVFLTYMMPSLMSFSTPTRKSALTLS